MTRKNTKTTAPKTTQLDTRALSAVSGGAKYSWRPSSTKPIGGGGGRMP